MSDRPKTEPKNCREVVLHISVFYDCTKTDPEKLAAEFDGLFQGVRMLHREELEREHGPTHCNKLHVPEQAPAADAASAEAPTEESP